MAASSSARTVVVAATQMACSADSATNITKATELVRAAAAKGANVILLQELFETQYFCQDQMASLFLLAKPFDHNPLIQHFAALAAELGVVLPISFFEAAGPAHFNSIAMIDADGTVLGVYRKSHIPDGPGYQEKFYFSPGDTGFKVWTTKFGCIGVGICWDQWFPEAARAMALLGAELILYPTAIGSEPHDSSISSREHWTRVMQGHAGANLVPVIASNRVGTEAALSIPGSSITFYGSSFITDVYGKIVAHANETEDAAVITASFDLDACKLARVGWGVFRDRRPDLYKPLMSLDGSSK